MERRDQDTGSTYDCQDVEIMLSSLACTNRLLRARLSLRWPSCSHAKHQHAPIVSCLPKPSVIHHRRSEFIKDVMPRRRDIAHPKPLDLLIAILHLLAEMQSVEGKNAPGGVTFGVVALVRVF